MHTLHIPLTPITRNIEKTTFNRSPNIYHDYDMPRSIIPLENNIKYPYFN